MSYYIYQNWRANGHYAKIHRSECGFCNEGEGMHRKIKAGYENGKWHGSYSHLVLAEKAAESLPHPTMGKPEITKCRCCKK